MDLKKLKQRLNDLEADSKTGKSKLVWKPTEGKQVIRIVPYKFDKNWPFIELYFYYGLAKRTILSPVSFEKPDPIKEFSDKLLKTGDQEDYKLSKQLQPKFRCYAPILVRGKEEEGVKYWGFGNTIYNELLKTIDDPDYSDITDLELGRDIKVEYKKAEKDGEFPKTTIRVSPKQTDACIDVDGCTAKQMEEHIKNMADIKTEWPEMNGEELAAILEKFMDATPEPEATDAPKDTFLDDLNEAGKSKEKLTTATSAVDDFDDLFDKE